jgi:predicted RecA/RadA family phage recombinase
MKNYIQTGKNITVAAPALVKSGAGVLVGKMFGVASGDAAITADVTIVREGVFLMAKKTAQSWTAGAAVYWDDTAKVVTTTVGTNQMIGCAVLAGASDDATGTVLLDGVIRA